MVQHHELDNDKRHLSYAAINLLILDIKAANNVKFMAKIAKIKVKYLRGVWPGIFFRSKIGFCPQNSAMIGLSCDHMFVDLQSCPLEIFGIKNTNFFSYFE